MLGRTCSTRHNSSGSTSYNAAPADDQEDDRDTDVLFGKHTGAIRASLGLSSSWNDCEVLLDFLKREYLNKTRPATLFSSESEITPDQKYSNNCLQKEWNGTQSTNGDGSHHIEQTGHVLPLEQYCVEQLKHKQDSMSNQHKESICDNNYFLCAVIIYPIKSCEGEWSPFQMLYNNNTLYICTQYIP